MRELTDKVSSQYRAPTLPHNKANFARASIHVLRIEGAHLVLGRDHMVPNQQTDAGAIHFSEAPVGGIYGGKFASSEVM
jgi:hypothetical protein